MLLEYTINKNDYLNLQLYYISIDEAFNKRRKHERFRLSGFMLLFGLVSLMDNQLHHYSFILIPAAILFFFIYPWWSAWFYRRIYKRQMPEDIKKDFPYSIKLSLDEEVITYDSTIGKDSYQAKDISKIIEINEYFYLVIPQIIWIIIPKSEIPDIKMVQTQFESYESAYSIPFERNENWKWK